MKKSVELKPIKESTQDYEKIELLIKRAFNKYIYFPLIKELNLSKKVIHNALKGLKESLQEGLITYSRGAFRGKFNSESSKELKALGAKWDKKTSAFKLTMKEVPYEYRDTIYASESHFKARMERIETRLKKIDASELATAIRTEKLFDSTLWKVEKDFQKSVKNLTVAPELTKAQSAKLAEAWQNNMDLWIKDFTEKQIKELRATVKSAVLSGNRHETLVKGIQKSYNVTANKAKFLARQETALAMNTFKMQRYLDAGVTKYKWGCVKMPHDKAPPSPHVKGNVRYAHGILEGSIQDFRNPPLTSNPGEAVTHNNPGLDYNCRCFSIPIVEF